MKRINQALAFFLLFVPTMLWAQATARFTDVTAASGIKVNTEKRPRQPQYGTQRPHGVAVEDFDGDGKMDIILVCFGKPYVQLFRNLGGLRFKDVTKGSGLESFQGWGTGAAVADFDRDGILDVYLTSVEFDRNKRNVTPRGKESRLYKGLGKGKFKDVSEASGTLLSRPGRCPAWSDIDGDGWVDLFIACPYSPSVLFRNNRDGTFTDVTNAAGVTLAGRASLGCAFGDVDGDGRDDLFVANYYSQSSALLKNLGGGKFRDMTKAAGLDRKASGVGCVFADVSNRGRFDLFVTTDSWLSGANYTEKQLLARGKHRRAERALRKRRQGALQTDLGQDAAAQDALARCGSTGLGPRRARRHLCGRRCDPHRQPLCHAQGRQSRMDSKQWQVEGSSRRLGRGL